MKINGVHDRGVKNYLVDDPANFVNALWSCIADSFPINGIPDEITDRMKLLRTNGDKISKQFAEMIQFLKVFKLEEANEQANRDRKPRTGSTDENVRPRRDHGDDVSRVD